MIQGMTSQEGDRGESRSRGTTGVLRRLPVALALIVLATGCRGGSTGEEASPTLPIRVTPTILSTLAELPLAPTRPMPPTATPGCEGGTGRVEAASYPGAIVRQDIPFRVYLPPCYDSSAESYPTLYLLHGKPYDESQWDELGADRIAEAAIATGEWPAFLIVMPRQPEPLFSSTDGGPRSYEAEILEGLLPYVERTYRADPVPQGRAIAGISRGGVWALEIGLRNPEVFGAAAALSPALAVNHPRPAYDPFRIVAAGGELPKWIFLGAGETDWARSDTERLAGSLTAAGAEPRLEILPGGHDAEYWTSALQPMMEFLVEGWCGCGATSADILTPLP